MASPNDKTNLFVLTETTLPTVLWRAFRGRKISIISTLSYVRLLSGVLRMIKARLEKRGLAQPLEEVFPDLPWFEGAPAGAVFDNVHAEIETRLHEAYPPPAGAPTLGEFAYAMRKAATDYSAQVIYIFSVIKWLDTARPPEAWRLHGPPPLLGLIYEACLGKPPPFPHAGAAIKNAAFNLLNVVSFVLLGTAWLLVRTRPFPVKPRSFILAVDTIRGKDEEALLAYVLDAPEDGLVVYRTKRAREIYGEMFEGYTQCVIGDARISVVKFLEIAGRMWRDMICLSIVSLSLDPRLFGRYCAIIAKRGIFCAFFTKFRPKNFWGRDDYSIDHVVRNSELRKIGGRSFGHIHGHPMDVHQHQWREIDFDVLYTFDAYIYEHCYKNSWPDHMAAKAVGNIHMTPDYRRQIQQKRPLDIIFFPIVHRKFSYIMEEVFKVATHFSDRTVYIKMKARRAARHMQEIDDLFSKAPVNVVALDQFHKPYDAMMEVSYAINSGSTLSMECLQFRLMTFVFDVDPGLKFFYYRNFPGLTVSKASEIIEKISQIEGGEYEYPFDQYVTEMGLSEANLFETLRADIGLPPRTSAPASRKKKVSFTPEVGGWV